MYACQVKSASAKVESIDLCVMDLFSKLGYVMHFAECPSHDEEP